MPTKFSDVYDRAIFKITDYSFLTSITDFKEAVMQKYLFSAISDFQYACTVDITKFDTRVEQFDEELDNEMLEILSLGIAYYWLSAQVLNKELLKNRIYNKDYTSYSPANLLNEMKSLREDLRAEYMGKINAYSFRHGNIEFLKV